MRLSAAVWRSTYVATLRNGLEKTTVRWNLSSRSRLSLKRCGSSKRIERGKSKRKDKGKSSREYAGSRKLVLDRNKRRAPD